MERFPALTRARLKQLAGDMKALIYSQLEPVEKLSISGPTDRISYDKAIRLSYKPVKLGQQLGPLWSTFWFHVSATAPANWAGKRVDLLWNSLSEATLWIDGKPKQGLNLPYGERPDAVLTEKAKAGQKFSFYVEMACNTPYGVWLEDKSPHVPPFSLERCELALFDPIAWQMYLDFTVLQELETELSTDSAASDMTFAGILLFELNRFANEYDLNDQSTWAKAHKILKDLYKYHNATGVHHAYAVGHGHLDTAWLWPIAETYRKLLRTWTNQLDIMNRYSEYKFACSAAFHYQSMKERYPEIYRKVKEKVKSKQWFPVGGTWVEPDCNMPSGESLARQFLYGQRFFEKEFGKRCREFFNPDVFGYSGQLPQIMKQSGIDYFITCKLHENELNKPDYHTFLWQGIDGSKILTHFPPLRFFTVPVTVNDMRNVLKRFRDHDRTSASMILYGHGDGGGGPTKEMVERLNRYQDLQALPKTTMSGPEAFFAAIEAHKEDLPRHIGEIYFE
jgi:alpha-mannosidase